MIRLAIPFLLSNIEQIPRELDAIDKFLLEGTVIDAQLFDDEQYWILLTKSIEKLNFQMPGALWSLHFPVEHADYLASTSVLKHMHRFVDFAASHNIHTVTLHTNNIIPITKFDINKLHKVRRSYLDFFYTLDQYISGSSLIIAVENLPIIGNLGDDFDSVFVFPEDFSDFHFNKLMIAWDIGHWAYTWMLMKSLSNISDHINTSPVEFDDFFHIKERIRYFHFSSFHGFGLPYMKNKCLEGIIPSEGDFDEDVLIDCMKKIHSYSEEYVVTLEIQDVDYTKRVNLMKTIQWFKDKIF